MSSPCRSSAARTLDSRLTVNNRWFRFAGDLLESRPTRTGVTLAIAVVKLTFTSAICSVTSNTNVELFHDLDAFTVHTELDTSTISSSIWNVDTKIKPLDITRMTIRQLLHSNTVCKVLNKFTLFLFVYLLLCLFLYVFYNIL